MKKKLAIIFSGGGMACAYGGGAAYALWKDLKIRNPDIIIAASGGVGTACYYLSGQYKKLDDIWCNRLADHKGLVNVFRIKKIFDIDYLVDEVIKKEDKLDIKKIKKSKTKLFVAVLDAHTGLVEWFTNKSKVSFYELIRASKAVPVAYNKHVSIRGKNYIDCCSFSREKALVKKAVEEGAKKIILVSNFSKDRTRNDNIRRIWMLFKNKVFKKNYHTKFKEIKKFTLPEGVELIKMHTRNEVALLDNRKKSLVKAFDKGRKETIKTLTAKKVETTKKLHN